MVEKGKNIVTRTYIISDLNREEIFGTFYEIELQKANQELVPVPVDLSKLSDAVKTDVVKKDAYNAKIKNIEDKIPDITNLPTDTTLNAKINDVKNEIPSITNLATTAALNPKVN